MKTLLVPRLLLGYWTDETERLGMGRISMISILRISFVISS